MFRIDPQKSVSRFRYHFVLEERKTGVVVSEQSRIARKIEREGDGGRGNR